MTVSHHDSVAIRRGEAHRCGQAETHDAPDHRIRMPLENDHVRVTIRRFDPADDRQPYLESYLVPSSPYMRVLDALNYIAEELSSDVAYRWSCGVKKCGTCAVRVNGREVLACWEPAEREMVIEPLRHLPVVRDLVVDRSPYEQRVQQLEPWLQRKTPYPGFPERVGHHDMKPALKALDCVNCMACFSACPVLDLEGDTPFVGPAPLVQLAQAAFDPRDEGDRTAIIAAAGVFDCVSCYKCEQACPVHIPIVSQVIEPLKRRLYQDAPEEARHAGVFMRLIARRGFIEPSALVMLTQGLGVLRHPLRIIRLVWRGKAKPLRMLSVPKFGALAEIRRIFNSSRESM